MAFHMNLFRVLADVSHTLSKCILIWAIHWNKSAEGVSLITQSLYIAVFLTRYLDLFWVSPSRSLWNFVLKNFYIGSSVYIIVIMLRVYARTREREKAWRFGAICAAGSLVLAPFMTLIVDGTSGTTFIETTVPTVIDSYYLVTLGSYRAFYILNWIVRGAKEHTADWNQIIFGVIQTALYIDFAWVYYTRQRVKLRGGGIVDSDDMRKSWIVNRVLGAAAGRTSSLDEEAAANTETWDGQTAGETRKSSSRWGARGVSVSADDTLDEHQRQSRPRTKKEATGGTEDELQGMLSDDEEDDGLKEHANRHSSTSGGANGRAAVLNSGGEWDNH
ncbi:MAG: hypothetical protein Q9227_000052 [Pyrenula ochraceoflavens]